MNKIPNPKNPNSKTSSAIRILKSTIEKSPRGNSMNRTHSLLFVITMLLSACATPTAAPAPTKVPEPTAVAQPLAATASGAVRVTGKFTYSNNIITEYYVEHFVALINLTGFVKRDREWEVPVKSQVLGYLQLDEKAQKGEYQLSLPLRPEEIGRAS